MYKCKYEHFNNSWRKIHAFNLAEQLNKQNYLKQLITSYLNFMLTKILKKSVKLKVYI